MCAFVCSHQPAHVPASDMLVSCTGLVTHLAGRLETCLPGQRAWLGALQALPCPQPGCADSSLLLSRSAQAGDACETRCPLKALSV